jgi:hypothetical protein
MRGASMLMFAASVSALRMGGLARVRSPCMVIEPEIYREPGVRPTLASVTLTATLNLAPTLSLSALALTR